MGEPYHDMYRDPYEQQQIAAEMTEAIERDPATLKLTSAGVTRSPTWANMRRPRPIWAE